MVLIKQLSLLTATTVVLSLNLFPTNKAEAYTFTKIYTDSSSYFDFPEINNNGTIVYSYNRSNSINISKGGTPLTIPDDNGSLIAFTEYAINDNDTVVFSAVWKDTEKEGIFSSNGGAITTVVNSTLPYRQFRILTINNNGTITFIGFIEPFIEQNNSGILTIGNGITTLIAKNENTPPFYVVDQPAINDKETVVFVASSDPVESPLGGEPIFSKSGIFTSNGGIITPIVNNSNSFLGFENPVFAFESPVINNKGTIAFLAGFSDSRTGIFTINNGVINTIIDNLGLYTRFAINDEDTVAFQALSVNAAGYSGYSIFTNKNSVTTKVIGTGDSLFGSIVKDIFISNQALNNSGQLAFHARLEDGTGGIFRADPEPIAQPKSVPDPATDLSLLLMGAFGAASLLKRQQKHIRKEK